jgi:hypothetical protein
MVEKCYVLQHTGTEGKTRNVVEKRSFVIMRKTNAKNGYIC